MNSPEKRASKQLSLEDSLPSGSIEKSTLHEQLEPRRVHGGETRGKRKTSRPFQAKTPLHLILRSKRAKGTWSLLHRKNQAKVLRMIYVYAHRYQVKVYRASNTGNHLHLLVKASERKNLADYLRVLAGRVAVTVTGAQKGVKKVGRFWDHLYWSRMVSWGKDFHHVRAYVKELIHRPTELLPEADELYWKKIPAD